MLIAPRAIAAQERRESSSPNKITPKATPTKALTTENNAMLRDKVPNFKEVAQAKEPIKYKNNPKSNKE